MKQIFILLTRNFNIKLIYIDDVHFWVRFFTKDACLVPPGRDLVCRGNMLVS